MDGLTLKITSGNRKALALAKTLVTTPTLINIDSRQGAVYALPLDCETNQKEAAADVSESLVISTDAKKNIADNVAPGSKSWSLSGYIQGMPKLEPTSFFQPFVQLHTDILWNWFNRGAVLIFKDGNAQIYNHVVIKSLKTSQQKDCANAVPFSLSLKEINIMETSTVDMPDNETGDINKIKTSLANVGSALGAPIKMGMTAAQTAEQTA